MTGDDEDPTKTEHVTAHWRFAWHESRGQLLDDLESDLQPYVSWYRIQYHECVADETPSELTQCTWDETREYGTVPGDI